MTEPDETGENLTLNETHQQVMELVVKFCDVGEAGDYDYNVAFGAGCMYLAIMIRAFLEEHSLPFTKENVEKAVNKIYVQLGDSITFVMKMRENVVE